MSVALADRLWVRVRNVLIGLGVVALLIGICFLIPPSPWFDTPEPDPGPTLPEGAWVEYLPVEGRLVTCVFRSNYGISCDWANARPLDAGMTSPTAIQTSQTD